MRVRFIIVSLVSILLWVSLLCLLYYVYNHWSFFMVVMYIVGLLGIWRLVMIYYYKEELMGGVKYYMVYRYGVFGDRFIERCDSLGGVKLRLCELNR